MTSKGLGLVQHAFHLLCVLLSQQRSLVLVSLDVYLASCLSICLSYSVTVKRPLKKKKKIPGLETFCFLQKEYFAASSVVESIFPVV